MLILTYPRRAVLADYARAGAGLALTAGPALLADLPWPVLAVLWPLAVLFTAYAVQAWRRQRLALEVDAAGVASRPGGPRVGWSELDRVGLAYFSARRDSRDGWMELTLGQGRQVLRVDSRLEGFEALVQRAIGAARAGGVALDARTVANLEALGIDARPGPSAARAAQP